MSLFQQPARVNWVVLSSSVVIEAWRTRELGLTELHHIG